MTFPNTKNIAYFNPNSQLVFLKNATSSEIINAFRSQDFSTARHHLATIYHELTHWADTIGTIWGNEYLKKVYRAYDIIPNITKQGSESDFHRFIDLHDMQRRLSYSDYYRTVDHDVRQHSLKDPWGMEFSTGVEFNSAGRVDENRPILFAKFMDKESRRQIVRQPISTAALLETTATWSEMTMQYATTAPMPDDQKTLERYIIDKEYGGILYEPELTLYTAPVHLLARYLRVTNAAEAYRIGALISLVCLNLVPSHFRKLRIPKGLEEWGLRVNALIRAESRPFAFKCICMNASKGNSSENHIDRVNAALHASNLPSYDEILNYAVTRIKEDKATCHDPLMAARQRYLRELGADWLDWRRSNEDSSIDYRHVQNAALSTPCMYDRDDRPFLIFGSKFNSSLFDPVDMYNREATLHTQILNFRRACR